MAKSLKGNPVTSAPPEPNPTGDAKPEPKPEPPKPPQDPAARSEYLEAELKKWRGRAENSYGLLNTLGISSSEDATALKDKATRADALEQELMSDKDKAIAEASKAAATEADAKYRPLLVRARIEAAAAGRVETERLDALLDPLDMSKFLTASGDVDTDKVSAYVNGIAPEKSNQPTPKGPVVPTAPRSGGSGSGVSAGSALWEQRHPNRTST